jgi:DNA-binding beta-propeller fold protein YncE
VTRKINLILAAVLVLFSFMAAEDEPKEGDITTIYDKPTTLVYPSFWHTPFGIHRGTQVHLKLFLGNRTYFDDPQDLAATKLVVDYGKINKDKDDWQLTVYGCNSGRGEIIYNISMHSLGTFGSKGSRDGQLLNPKGIACNEYGDVYVVDTDNDRIARFYNSGKKVKFIRNIGGPGSEPGKFNKPSYVALDSTGKIYVTDTGNNRIQVFSKSGGYLYSIGQEKGISNPQGICVCDEGERYSGYKNSFIYIIDGNYNRVMKFDLKGNLAQAIRVNEVLGKNVKLTTLEQDYYGNVYMVDNLNSQVYKFSPDLRFITDFGSFGTKDYEFESPTGIAIYKHYGQIFVSDKESAQYFWIGSDATNFKATPIKAPTGSKLQFDFSLTEKSFITLQVVDAGGNTVEVCHQIGAETGKNSIDWDIPDMYKSIIKGGNTYSIYLRIMSTYSSYPNIEKVLKTTVYIE